MPVIEKPRPPAWYIQRRELRNDPVLSRQGWQAVMQDGAARDRAGRDQHVQRGISIKQMFYYRQEGNRLAYAGRMQPRK